MRSGDGLPLGLRSRCARRSAPVGGWHRAERTRGRAPIDPAVKAGGLCHGEGTVDALLDDTRASPPAHRAGSGAQAAAARLRRRAVRRAGLRRHAGARHRPPRRRGQGPLLLVLREQGSAVPRAGRAQPPPAAQGPGRARWTRRPSRCCASARAPRRRWRSCRPTRTSSPCSRSRTWSKQFADVLRQGTEVHAADVARARRRRASPTAPIRDEDPSLLAYGVVGAVGYYGHFHRTGRVDLPVAELAAVRRSVRRLRPRRRRGDRRPRAPGVASKETGTVRPTTRPARSALCPQFLSDEWMDEAKKIREEFGGPRHARRRTRCG